MGKEARINAAKRENGLFAQRSKTGVPFKPEPLLTAKQLSARKTAASRRAKKGAGVNAAVALGLALVK